MKQQSASRQLWLIAEDRFSKITQPLPNIDSHGGLSFYAAKMKDIRETK